MLEIDIRAAVADNGSHLSSFGCRAGPPGMAWLYSHRRNPMKNDVDDIPMVYVLYVLIAIAVMVGIAAFAILRLI